MFRKTRRLGLLALTMSVVMCTSQAAFGQFNPYVIHRFNPVSPVNPVIPPGSFSSMPGSPLMGSFNPYANPYYNPYYGIGPVGGALMGMADVYRAYGTLIMNREEAYAMREKAVQAKLETRKKRFEVEMYIRSNTPTFVEEQTRIARDTLKRIQGHSMPAEITSGKALNLMIDDVRKFPGRKVALDQATISEHILLQLNVTATNFGLGVLRNDGKISWPVAVVELMQAEQLRTLEGQAQALVKGAVVGKMDPNVFRDFSAELDRASDSLSKRVNDIPGPQYLDAKRFLDDLKNARTALEKGEAQNQAKYQKAISGGKSAQEVADFMIREGLRFAPAAGQDEAAYRAFHSALVAFDIALNSEAPLPSAKSDK